MEKEYSNKKSRVNRYTRKGKIVRPFMRRTRRKREKDTNLGKVAAIAGLSVLGIAGTGLVLSRQKAMSKTKSAIAKPFDSSGIKPSLKTGNINPKEFSLGVDNTRILTAFKDQDLDYTASFKGMQVDGLFSEKFKNVDKMSILMESLNRRTDTPRAVEGVARKTGMITDNANIKNGLGVASFVSDDGLPSLLVVTEKLEENDYMGRRIRHSFEFLFPKDHDISELVKNTDWFEKDYLPKYYEKWKVGSRKTTGVVEAPNVTIKNPKFKE